MNRLKFSISLIILTAAIVAVSVYWLQSPTKPASTVGTSATEQQTISHVDIPVGTGELTGTVVLGSPTDTAIKINILANADMEAFVEYGISLLDQRSVTLRSSSGEPIVIELTGLRSDTSYTYRVQTKHADETAFSNGDDHTFHTQRATGSTFSFGIQGDSHPEREGKMFSSELYRITMHNVTAASPDLYFTLGDDFSIEKLISSDQVSGATVGQVYLDQRPYLDIIGADASLFLINGNHEQAAKYLLDGTANSPAVFAALARTTYFPLPTPGLFYSGDSEQVPDIGYLSDYY